MGTGEFIAGGDLCDGLVSHLGGGRGVQILLVASCYWNRRQAPMLISVSKTVDAIISNQDFQNARCHICFRLGLDKVETGYNLLME